MSKKELDYPQIDEILKPTKLDEFFNERIDDLPKDMPKKIRKKLLQDAKFFGEHGIKTDVPKKEAYPNYDYYMSIKPQRNINKWTETVKNMFYLIHKGLDRKVALEKSTVGWDNVERLDFENWLKFYQEGGNMKYKTAQAVNYWENNNRPGYFVPVYQNQNQNDSNNANSITQSLNANTHPYIDAEEKRRLIEKQRNKIIGRLDSAEKLLRSHEGQLFAGKEYETLLEIIYQLKKKIQTINKISISTKIYEDIIIREANILTKSGFTKAAGVLISVAQSIPNPTEPPNPTENVGIPGNLPGEGPGFTPPGAGLSDTSSPVDPALQSAPPGIEAGKNPGLPGDSTVPTTNEVPPTEPTEKPLSKGMKSFLDGLKTNNDTFVEEINENDDKVLISEAQVAPPINTLQEKPEIEIAEDQSIPEKEKDFDKILDMAFSTLTIRDVVNKLEDVAKVFKVRKIPQELGVIDMMLGQLGLSSLFPSLAEAINKSLESNQYISTRVDDILSRLRGTLETKDVDLTDETPAVFNKDVERAKQQLQSEDAEEKNRKKMKKDIENESLISDQSKLTPNVEIQEDLSKPTNIQSPLPKPQI